MSNNIVVASEGLLKKLDRMYKFGSKYNVFPYQEAARTMTEMKELANSIPDIESPENQDQLMQSELKRRLNGEALTLDQRITPRYYDFDTVISMYGIPESDINGLREWLVTNKLKTQESIEKLYQTKDIQNYKLGLPADIPGVRRQAEEFAAVHIQKYHKRLGKLLQDLTQVGEFLRDISAVPTTEGRSYFHPITNTLAIGIPAVCFTTEDGSLQIRERDLITLYGHEGMGHALNQVITKTNGLPYFLTKDTPLTSATMESVAQFYQNVIFEDLKNSPETQRDLGIQHSFKDIYQESKDISQLQEYQLKLFQYAITVLADKDLGQPQDPITLGKKGDLLNEVTLDPTYPLHFVEQHRYDFDSQGNLNPQLVEELRYCAQPVQRALDEFAKQGVQYEGDGRSKIDATLLKGFWTPIGYVNNAKLKAQDK
jgi:hypothetical protein|tara:strand:+ start:76 stop:1359 length:1284 start_codon:yes stop_codon:yes gene_type:complete